MIKAAFFLATATRRDSSPTVLTALPGVTTNSTYCSAANVASSAKANALLQTIAPAAVDFPCSHASRLGGSQTVRVSILDAKASMAHTAAQAGTNRIRIKGFFRSGEAGTHTSVGVRKNWPTSGG